MEKYKFQYKVGHICWLASRLVEENSSDVNFNERYVNSDGNCNGNNLWNVNDSNANGNNNNNTLRPVASIN